ncbi:MAG: homoserine kinase [Hyphomicrobiaceae bacterium]|nr:homoserine kinase [Hyphomicrobiaceae bacterium]
MAVYTEVNDEDLRLLLERYDAGELLSYKGIAEGVENTNYIVHTTKSPLILTLYEKRVAVADLPFFLGLMEHLAGRGVACPVPLRDREGRLIADVAGRRAALVTFIEGFWVRKPKPAHCLQVGRALAQLHEAGGDFALTRANALGLPGWRPLFDSFAKDADDIAPGLAEFAAEELTHLDRSWPSGLPAGVIHGDMFPDNVFFLGDTLSGVIDFYFACNDALAYDLAICLNAWCFEQDFAFNITKGRALLKGYEEVRPLSAPEKEALPLLARGAAVRFLLTRCYDWINTPDDAFVDPHDPIDYYRRLRFHQQCRTIRDYGYDG